MKKEITMEQIEKLTEMYKANKESLMEVKNQIEEFGYTDDGVTNVYESFEQGWNNAMEFMFEVLDIKYKGTVKDLKARDDYEFECSMTDEYKDMETDEWGCAFVWLGDIGAEYNFCIDDENCSAIYKAEIEDDLLCTDYDTSIHYEIDFDDVEWEKKLEDAMCNALIKFFEL